MGMDFLSDESTLLNSESSSIFPTIPPCDYVWKSPRGEALPGRHHQLILHLLSRDDTWRDEPGRQFSAIRLWLGAYYPGHELSTTTIGAIADEYVSLSSDEKVMYRVTNAFTITTAQDPRDWGSAVQQTNTTTSIVDGLQDQIIPESLEIISAANTIDQFHLQLATGTAMSHDVKNNCVAADNQDISYTLGGGLVQPSVDDDMEITELNAVVQAPLYLRALADLRAASQSAAAFNSETNTKLSEAQPAHLNDVFPEMRDNNDTHCPSAPTADSKPVPSIIPLPDPTNYIQTSKNHWRIPSCEADKFVAHFHLGLDSIPHKIDGYFWYCQTCYDPSADRQASMRNAGKLAKGKGLIVKGKFSSKRSVEKHYADIHKTSWKCEVLPEPERFFGIVPEVSVTRISTDIAMQEVDSSTSHSSTAATVLEENEDVRNEETGGISFGSEDSQRLGDLLDEEDFGLDSDSEDNTVPDTPSPPVTPRTGEYGKQKAWEEAVENQCALRRLSNAHVTFADKKEVREFDETGYGDQSPADVFYPKVEPEPSPKPEDLERKPKRLRLTLKIPTSDQQLSRNKRVYEDVSSLHDVEKC